MLHRKKAPSIAGRAAVVQGFARRQSIARPQPPARPGTAGEEGVEASSRSDLERAPQISGQPSGLAWSNAPASSGPRPTPGCGARCHAGRRRSLLGRHHGHHVGPAVPERPSARHRPEQQEETAAQRGASLPRAAEGVAGRCVVHHGPHVTDAGGDARRTSWEMAPSKLTAKKMAAAVLTGKAEGAEQPEGDDGLHHEPAPNASREKRAASCRTTPATSAARRADGRGRLERGRQLAVRQCAGRSSAP